MLCIIGLLAGTAIPMASQVISSARATSVLATAGELRQAADRANVWYRLQGQDNSNVAWWTNYPGGGAGYLFSYGYPTWWAINQWANIQGLSQGWGSVGWRYLPATALLDAYFGNSHCHVEYLNATATTPYDVVVDVTGC